MTKYSKIRILLVVLLVGGCFPGIYAIPMDQHDKVMSINNVSVDGSKTIYVAKNGTDRNEGLTPTKPKRNIINAINDANPGDSIRVGAGTYPENLVINKNLTLIGEDPSNTIIDGRQITSCIYITGATVTITGFTIKNGNATDDYYGYIGGGIKNEGMLTLKNSIITDNNAFIGGGIYNEGIMNISNVTIKNNKIEDGGGGIKNSGSLSIEDSVITDNIQGINNNGNMNITRVTIKNNIGGDGAGILTWGKMIIIDSIIRDNNGTYGGGIKNSNLLYIYGSTIINNRANNGGGILNLNISRSVAYIDDKTIISDNYVNNFEGAAFIPA